MSSRFTKKAALTTEQKYAKVNEKLLATMEAGDIPWRKPWKQVSGLGGFNPNLHHNAISGRAYSGGNVWTLQIVAMMENYESNEWMTYNQAYANGGNVKRGERGTMILFWEIKEKQETVTDPDTGEETVKIRKLFNLASHVVFNVAQTENVKIPNHKTPEPAKVMGHHEIAEVFIANYTGRDNDGPSFTAVPNGDRAFYAPLWDAIQVPDMRNFPSRDEYYSTSFHEMGHSTGHESRLARLETATFGDHAYSFEELVAELTAAYLCMHSGIDNTIENSAAYLKNWLSVLKNDVSFFHKAASKAQKAADLIIEKSMAAQEAAA